MLATRATPHRWKEETGSGGASEIIPILARRGNHRPVSLNGEAGRFDSGETDTEVSLRQVGIDLEAFRCICPNTTTILG